MQMTTSSPDKQRPEYNFFCAFLRFAGNKLDFNIWCNYATENRINCLIPSSCHWGQGRHGTRSPLWTDLPQTFAALQTQCYIFSYQTLTLHLNVTLHSATVIHCFTSVSEYFQYFGDIVILDILAYLELVKKKKKKLLQNAKLQKIEGVYLCNYDILLNCCPFEWQKAWCSEWKKNHSCRQYPSQEITKKKICFHNTLCNRLTCTPTGERSGESEQISD